MAKFELDNVIKREMVHLSPERGDENNLSRPPGSAT